MNGVDPAYQSLPGGGLTKKLEEKVDKKIANVTGAIYDYIDDAIVPIQITGDVTNAPDEEDLTSVNNGNTDVLRFKDKAYAPANYSGLGRKYLRKNILGNKNVLTQAMMNDANTIYVIQYDYDLNGQNITVPSGCVLQFEGGSLNNVRRLILSSNTVVQGNGIIRGGGLYPGFGLVGIVNVSNVLVKDIIVDTEYAFYNRVTQKDLYDSQRNATGVREGLYINNSSNVTLFNVTSMHGLTGFSIGNDSYDVVVLNCSSIETIGDGVEHAYCHDVRTVNHTCKYCQDDPYSCNAYSKASRQPYNINIINCSAHDCFGRLTLGGRNIKVSHLTLINGRQVPFVFESRVGAHPQNCIIEDSTFITFDEVSGRKYEGKKALSMISANETSEYAENCIVRNTSIKTLSSEVVPLLLLWDGTNIEFEKCSFDGYMFDIRNTNNISFKSCSINSIGGVNVASNKGITEFINTKITYNSNDQAYHSMSCLNVYASNAKIIDNDFIKPDEIKAVRITGSRTLMPKVTLTEENFTLVNLGYPSIILVTTFPMPYNISQRESNVLTYGQKVSLNNVIWEYDGTRLIPTTQLSGTTAQRPASTNIYTGFQYWDTDLGKMIAWNGTTWVNLDGTALA